MVALFSRQLHPTRLALLTTVLLTTLALAACGGSDEGDGGDNAVNPSGGATAANTDTAPTPSSDPGAENGTGLAGDVEQARRGRAAVSGLYEDLAAATAATDVASTDVPVGNSLAAAEANASLRRVCDLMSAAAQRQIVEYIERSARLSNVSWTCEKAMGLMLRRARQAGTLKSSTRAEVVGVNADDDRATATLRFGKARQLTTISLVKEGGEWKIGTAPGGGG